jgi:hypothetical protein
MPEDIGTTAEALRVLQEAKLFASLSERVRLRLPGIVCSGSCRSIEALIKTHSEVRFTPHGSREYFSLRRCWQPGYVKSVEALLVKAGPTGHRIHMGLFTPIG